MFDLVTLIKTVGYLGLFGIVFAESGLFVGFFLPGDSLLFTAGFLAAEDYLAIEWVILLCVIGAILGDSFGYWFGRKVGPAIFTREDSLVFHKRHLKEARLFYEKHGGKTIVLARFMPIVRTFAPILAGVGHMPYATFLFYNVTGGLLWAVSLPLLGFYLGKQIPDIDRYLLPIIAAIIVVSLLPPLLHLLREPAQRRRLMELVRLKKRTETK